MNLIATLISFQSREGSSNETDGQTSRNGRVRDGAGELWWRRKLLPAARGHHAGADEAANDRRKGRLRVYAYHERRSPIDRPLSRHHFPGPRDLSSRQLRRPRRGFLYDLIRPVATDRGGADRSDRRGDQRASS